MFLQMDSVKLYCLMERPTGIVCKLSTTAQELFSSFPDPFCQGQSASSGLVQKTTVTSASSVTLPSKSIHFSENKKGMVSLGSLSGGSGKPATLSTTVSENSPWVYAQRPTPDRCECSSSSQVAGASPKKFYQNFQIGNKSTTLIQYVTRNIYKENRKGLPGKLQKSGILGDSGSSPQRQACKKHAKFAIILRFW